MKEGREKKQHDFCSFQDKNAVRSLASGNISLFYIEMTEKRYEGRGTRGRSVRYPSWTNLSWEEVPTKMRGKSKLGGQGRELHCKGKERLFRSGKVLPPKVPCPRVLVYRGGKGKGV